MTSKILNALVVVVLFSTPSVIFGQAPNLGTTSNFAVFTAAGAINNVGLTTVTGDIGTHVGAFNGFPPGVIVSGTSYVANSTSAQAAMDINLAYNYLSGITGGVSTAIGLGNGQVLTPGIYKTVGASTLNGDLILDGKNDPNALFIFQIGGAFSTGIASRIIVINSASLCNVYWQINEAVTLGENSIFRGSIVANGAISLSLNASLIGRGLTRAGAINLNTNAVAVGLQPTASIITASGVVNGSVAVCSGNSVTLSGNAGGYWSNGATTPSITVTTSGEYFVTNTNSCSINSNHIIVTINPLPTAIAGSAATICNGNSATLGSTPIAEHTYLWTPTVGLSLATIANPIASPSTTTTYLLTETITATGCSMSNSVVVTVSPLPIASMVSASGATTFCAGNSVTLSGNSAGTWSNGATTASITVNATGDYFVINTNGCGSINSNHIATIVNSLPIASVITASGPTTFCAGNSVTLSGNSAGTWSNGATTTSITATTSGDYIVINTNSCGTVNSNLFTITVNPLPSATTGSSVTLCNGISANLGSAPIAGNTYLWTPTTGLSSVDIANPKANPSVLTTYTLTETTATGCQKSNSVIVNPQPTCSCACN